MTITTSNSSSVKPESRIENGRSIVQSLEFTDCLAPVPTLTPAAHYYVAGMGMTQ